MSRLILSGIQPSGELHIGNYLGAMVNWVELSRKIEGFYCIVDYHAITVPYDPQLLQERIFRAAVGYIAAGLDLERSHIFVQSRVPEHTELAWILNNVAPMGLLERMTQFKDKARQHHKNLNAGLFTYPVLQAADILLYKATDVPVGEDQAQHIELTRELAQKFNHRFGPTFPEPRTLLTGARRILGLDGKAKMSKSLNNHIALEDSPEQVAEKLKTAVTDTRRVRLKDPGDPEKCNIYTLHGHFTPPEKREELAAGCRSASIGCFQCKQVLAENINKRLEPLRRRMTELQKDPDTVRDILAAGAETARARARETMDEVRSKIGVR